MKGQTLTPWVGWRIQWKEYMLCARIFRIEAQHYPSTSIAAQHFRSRAKDMAAAATTIRNYNTYHPERLATGPVMGAM